MANYTKLISAGLAVATIGSYVFNFNNFNSKDNLIKQGIDKIKAVALRYKADLADLQEDYDNLLKDVQASENALEQARVQLKAIYEKLTGKVWDDATQGDIINHDFDQYLKDQEQFENNVDGNEIAKILGLPEGASTQEIIEAIQDLLETIRDLEVRVEQLEAQVASLEAEIQTYKDEQDDLVEEINGLKTKLDNATAEANAIIDNANTEEQAQLDYINNTLTELGAEQVQEQVPEEDEGESQAQQLSFVKGNVSPAWSNKDQFNFKDEYIAAFNNLGLEAVTENPEVAVDFVSMKGNEGTVEITDEVGYNKLMEQAEDGKLYYDANTCSFVDSSQAGNAGIYTIVLTH